MTPLAWFCAIWFAGMLWQGHRMLGNVPDQIRDLFRVAPVLMFTCFVGVLFLVWPAWMAWDIWNRIREVWVKWAIRRATKDLQDVVRKMHDFPEEPKP